MFADLLAQIGEPHLRVVEDPDGTADLRGIDVSVAFDDRKLRVIERRSHRVHLRYATRDIFEVVFELLDTGERLVVIAAHWPSRRQGQYGSEPFRIAVAENIAFLVRDHVRFDAPRYLSLQAAGDLAAVRTRFDPPILIMGDFNDEPGDRSVIHHLQASSERDRVAGPTNDIDRFIDGSRYRGDDTFLYNPCWRFLGAENAGTFFIDSTSDGQVFANRYQVLDQFVVSRGLLGGSGLRLDEASVAIIDSEAVATQPAKRPRKFSRKTRKGTWDHLPIIAALRY
jgi:hypothetical protein